MSQLGCDVDEMTALEELLARHGQQLTSSATRIDGVLARLTWWGSDATAFGGQWRGQGRAALIAAANLLESSSSEVKRNRVEQIVASDGTGGGNTVDTGAAGGAGTGSADGPQAELPDPSKPGALAGGPLIGRGSGGDAKVEIMAQHKANGTTETVEKTTVVDASGMEHVTTKTTVTDAAGKEISTTTDVEPPKQAKPETEVQVDIVSGSVDARQDILASAGGTQGENYAASYDASLGARESASGSVTLGKDGLKAEGSVSAFVGGQVSGAAELRYGVVSAGGSATAKAGASAEAKGHASIGLDGVHAGAGASAELAATVDGEAHVDVAGVTGKVKGGVGAGLGAHADVDASFGVDKIGAKVDFGAYVGLGGNLSFDVSVDPQEVATSLLDVGEKIGDFGSDAFGGISDVVGGAGDFFSW